MINSHVSFAAETIDMNANRLLTIGLLVIICAGYGTLLAQVGLTSLTPDLSFSISKDANAGLKLREMRIGNSGLWLLAQAPNGEFSIIRTGTNGAALSTTPVPAGVRASGLAAAGPRVATVLFKERKPVLAQFEAGGRLASELPLGCFMAESLLSIEGEVGIVCPDETIAKYSTAAQTHSYSSWARPGSLLESLSGNRLAVVDQVTGQFLLNDLGRGTISTVAVDVPEIAEARKKNDAASAALPPRPSQKQLLVMDTAQESNDIYLLVFPYQVADGPSVVRLSAAGKLVARYTCKTPGGDRSTFHKIEVQNGFLFLGSVSGTIFRYKL